jgi:diacylglycerol kinase family enzyme
MVTTGQSFFCLKIMDNTDAVLVAGGDGTIMEAVTGGADCFL